MDHLPHTARIVAAYVGNHAVLAGEIPLLIDRVHGALGGLGATPQPAPLVPAVSPRKSITPDYLVCLEDGRRLKSLKRHLRCAYNLTPEDYRAKWGLPHDYPMVAPNYSAERSVMAKQMGLGLGGRPAPKRRR